MKSLKIRYLIMLIFGFSTLGSRSQSLNTSGYMMFYETSNTARMFKLGESSFIEFFTNKKAKIDDKDYFTRIRHYSWGVKDTSYFREDEQNYYHYNAKGEIESILLPKQVEVGDKWFEVDNSWSYKVIGVNEKLKTPIKKYTDLLLIESKQQGGSMSNKLPVYHLYYAKGVGLVATVNEGEIGSYLVEIREGAKEGEIIEGK